MQVITCLGRFLKFSTRPVIEVCTGAMKETSSFRLLQKLSWDEMKTRRIIHKLTSYSKIVNNLTPSYLRDLLSILRVSGRTCFPLSSAHNFTPFFFCSFWTLETVFLPFYYQIVECYWPGDSFMWYNYLWLLGQYLTDYYRISDYFLPFDYSLVRYCSIIPIWLRLGSCALYYFLFKIRVTFFPIFICCLIKFTIYRTFLYCFNLQ